MNDLAITPDPLRNSSLHRLFIVGISSLIFGLVIGSLGTIILRHTSSQTKATLPLPQVVIPESEATPVLAPQVYISPLPSLASTQTPNKIWTQSFQQATLSTWKTFINEADGFSFLYPPDLQIAELLLDSGEENFHVYGLFPSQQTMIQCVNTVNKNFSYGNLCLKDVLLIEIGIRSKVNHEDLIQKIPETRKILYGDKAKRNWTVLNLDSEANKTIEGSTKVSNGYLVVRQVWLSNEIDSVSFTNRLNISELVFDSVKFNEPNL